MSILLNLKIRAEEGRLGKKGQEKRGRGKGLWKRRGKNWWDEL
jgi:hypothetical protein